MLRIASITFLFLFNVACSKQIHFETETKPLSGITLTVDPGHGDTQRYDDFRFGPKGEREEWVNLRVAKKLKKLLEGSGATVNMTRTRDRDVSLGGRAAIALRGNSDLLVSIHHNGSSDPEMDYPLIYIWGPASQNPASVDLAKELVHQMSTYMTFNQQELAGVFSDYLIYPRGTSVLRNTYAHIPGVIGECGFFTHAPQEKRLMSRRYNWLEAKAYHQAILNYVSKGLPSATPIIDDLKEFVATSEFPIVFKLQDGLGGHDFRADSIRAVCGEQTVNSSWNPIRGELTVEVPDSPDHRLTFQIYGRNAAGNALHPKQWTFLTKAGHEFRCADTWPEAFEEAESSYANLMDCIEKEAEDSDTIYSLAQKTLDLYRLSIQLQAVHMKALHAEKRILEMLELQQRFLPENDLEKAIEDQKERTAEYYPYVTQ